MNWTLHCTGAVVDSVCLALHWIIFRIVQEDTGHVFFRYSESEKREHEPIKENVYAKNIFWWVYLRNNSNSRLTIEVVKKENQGEGSKGKPKVSLKK